MRINNNKYGYKVCYKKQSGDKWRVYLVTNSLDIALWRIRWYEREPPKEKIENIIWEVLPIKTLFEYKLRWRNCPF